jgi:hypothetical protein
MPEADIAAPMMRDMGPLSVADRQRRWAPDFTHIPISQIEGLARGIGDEIVRPWRELILATAAGPGISFPSADTWKPKAALAITLLQGAGVD